MYKRTKPAKTGIIIRLIFVSAHAAGTNRPSYIYFAWSVRGTTVIAILGDLLFHQDPFLGDFFLCHLPEGQVADHGICRQHIKPFIGLAIKGNVTVPDASESDYTCEDIVQDARHDQSSYRPVTKREENSLGIVGRRGDQEHNPRTGD